MAAGCLYVCATPIGNLEDITVRVLRVLREVAVIAAEDTRRTRKLLNHYDIGTPVISLHEHNEAARSDQLVARLQAGESIALVSDAGMPGISDPGAVLIRAAIDADVALTVLPGATAFATALVGSGLPAERFLFEGFLPRHARRRRAHLELLRGEPRTLIFYEAPHRLGKTLADMLTVFGDRPVCVARELTKAFEQWQRGTLATIVTQLETQTPRGEYVLVVAGATPDDGASGPGMTSAADAATPEPEQIVQHVRDHMDAGVDKKTAVRKVARQFGLPRRTVYRAATQIDAGPPTGAVTAGGDERSASEDDSAIDP